MFFKMCFQDGSQKWLREEAKIISSTRGTTLEDEVTNEKHNQVVVKRNASTCIKAKNLSLLAFIISILVCEQVQYVFGNKLEEQSILGSSHKQSAQFIEQDTDNVHRIIVGRPVKLKCVISNIGDHKVAWFHKDKRLLLALDNKVVTWRERIHVSSHANTVFFLQIDSVQLSDKGQIICQLNTQPLQSQVHILDIIKPPQIKEQETTVNIEPVKEFTSVELRCAADGIPKPLIKWRRESQMHVMQPPTDRISTGIEEQTGDIAASSKEPSQMASQASSANHNELGLRDDLGNRQQQNQVHTDVSSSNLFSSGEKQDSKNLEGGDGVVGNKPLLPNQNKSFLAEGEVLRFDRISRYDMGFYICIASNGVPPSVSQRIFLPVSFVPRVTSTTKVPTSTLRSGRNRVVTSSNMSLRDTETVKGSNGNLKSARSSSSSSGSSATTTTTTTSFMVVIWASIIIIVSRWI